MQKSIWDYPYVGSMISTERSHSVNMGVSGFIEIRYRNKTIDRGSHISCWLLGTSNAWPPEIDIFETLKIDVNGHGPFFTYNSHGNPSNPPMTFDYMNATDFAAWHLLRFEWTPSTLTWKRDGAVMRTENNYLGARKMYFLVTMEGSDSWAGSPDASTRWPQEAQIDYVALTNGAASKSASGKTPSVRP